jgi:NAD(P)-dependent dehydrogenase (short-subunit alcohol dehydrogenase family)
MTADDATLDGSRVLVTGASRGYGAAIARALAARGARLVLTATDPSRLARVADDCRAAGAQVTTLGLDLASADSVDAAAAAVAAELPRLEGLVLNAGVLGPTGPLDSCDPDDVAHAMQVDMIGQVRLLQRLSPVIAERAGVVLVTSGAAGRPGYAGYALGKAGLEALGLMLREEWAPRGIRVVAVNPGPVRTDMRAQAHPAEDPATVPSPAERIAPVLAVLAGDDPGPRVQAAEWGLS